MSLLTLNIGYTKWRNAEVANKAKFYFVKNKIDFLIIFFLVKILQIWNIGLGEQLLRFNFVASQFLNHYFVKRWVQFLSAPHSYFSNFLKFWFEPGQFLAIIYLILYTQYWYSTTEVLLFRCGVSSAHCKSSKFGLKLMKARGDSWWKFLWGQFSMFFIYLLEP